MSRLAPAPPSIGANSLGLPRGIRACLFDLDGVLTDTAKLHAAAWKRMFDCFLEARARRTGSTFVPFDSALDYNRFVDGKQRADGVRSFLASRGIALPDHGPPGEDTVEHLGSVKNELVLATMADDGVDAYDGSVRYVHAARDAGLRCAVVSSSANCGEVLESAGIADLFDVRVDARVAEQERLRGKPAPDTYLAGARMLGVPPTHCAVFEDAIAGVVAGAAGGFGFVVGVDRGDQSALLHAYGADVVVRDLAELFERP